MRLAIGAIGTQKRGPEADLVADYLGRAAALARPLGLKGPELAVSDAPKNSAGTTRMDSEADLLLRMVRPGETLFILDERGTAPTSRALAGDIERALHGGVPGLCFLIGGADGHGAAVRERLAGGGAKAISFGPATWPHLLVRAMLCEQIYRAITILSGHPYHRD